jgi:hypothetical protein
VGENPVIFSILLFFFLSLSLYWIRNFFKSRHHDLQKKALILQSHPLFSLLKDIKQFFQSESEDDRQKKINMAIERKVQELRVQSPHKHRQTQNLKKSHLKKNHTLMTWKNYLSIIGKDDSYFEILRYQQWEKINIEYIIRYFHDSSFIDDQQKIQNHLLSFFLNEPVSFPSIHNAKGIVPFLYSDIFKKNKLSYLIRICPILLLAFSKEDCLFFIHNLMQKINLQNHLGAELTHTIPFLYSPHFLTSEYFQMTEKYFMTYIKSHIVSYFQNLQNLDSIQIIEQFQICRWDDLLYWWDWLYLDTLMKAPIEFQLEVMNNIKKGKRWWQIIMKTFHPDSLVACEKNFLYAMIKSHYPQWLNIKMQNQRFQFIQNLRGKLAS